MSRASIQSLRAPGQGVWQEFSTWPIPEVEQKLCKCLREGLA